MDKSTVLVLGGGVGGIVTANALRRLLPQEHRIVLIDRDAQHVFAPSLLWLITGHRKANKISRPLARLRRNGIEVIHGDIKWIDPERRVIRVNDTELAGDFVVVSLGASLAPERIPGLTEAGHTFYHLSGAERLRDAAKAFDGGRLVVLTASTIYKCPAAPYEAAMLLHDDLVRKRRRQVEVAIYAAEPAPMGVAGLQVSNAVKGLLQERQIGYYPAHQLTEVDPEQKRLRFANGEEASYDLLAFVPPHRAPTVTEESGLAEAEGWVPVDRHSLVTRFPGVYAIGDVTRIPLSVGKPLPKAGVFAHGEAEVVAQNIAHQITGKGTERSFSGDGSCFIEMGGGRAGFARGNFYAEPTPSVTIYRPGRRWHVGKKLFEWDWFRRQF